MTALHLARQLRSNQTETESRLWSRLRAHRLSGLKFRRQQPMGHYIVDFFCPDKKLIVELDGGQHLEQAEYDQIRDNWLKAQGFTVLRYWNNEVFTNLDGVLEDICRHAGVLEAAPPSPPTPLPSRERGATEQRAELSHDASNRDAEKAPPPRRRRGWGEGESPFENDPKTTPPTRNSLP